MLRLKSWDLVRSSSAQSESMVCNISFGNRKAVDDFVMSGELVLIVNLLLLMIENKVENV